MMFVYNSQNQITRRPPEHRNAEVMSRTGALEDGEFMVSYESKVGSRCQLNGLGRSRSPRKGNGYCTVVGLGPTRSQVRILFDGSRNPVSIHASYLEPDERRLSTYLQLEAWMATGIGRAHV